MVTRFLFAGALVLLAVQRLLEVRLSRDNEAHILEQGGHESSPGHFKTMQALHTAWFISALLEVFLLRRPFIPRLSAIAVVLLAAGQMLRYAAIRTLGRLWTVRIMTIPGRTSIRQGIYRHLRHPNYLGVALEIAAVPLLHSAYITAVAFSAANALLLFVRIRAEEQALMQAGDYGQAFEGLPRFFPKLSRL